MSSSQLITLLLLAILGAWLWHHLGIRQYALQAARQITQRAGVQLLDQSIYLRKVRVVRSKSSLIALERSYEFEFSTRGDRRFLGWVVMLGRRMERSELQPYTEDQLLQ